MYTLIDFEDKICLVKNTARRKLRETGLALLYIFCLFLLEKLPGEV